MKEKQPQTTSSVTSSTKDTNPKDAVGVKKVGISVLSWPVLFELALAVFEGARKYGKFNWRKVGVRASVYTDACVRHIAAWQEGEDIDPESGISHLVKAQACLHILRDAQIRNMMTDDRPPGTIGFVAVQNGIAHDLINRHPEAKEPITHHDSNPIEYTEEKADNQTLPPACHAGTDNYHFVPSPPGDSNIGGGTDTADGDKLFKAWFNAGPGLEQSPEDWYRAGPPDKHLPGNPAPADDIDRQALRSTNPEIGF